MPPIAPEAADAAIDAGGPPSTFDDLVRRFERPLLAFFSRRTADGGMAENLLQETFYKAFRYWHTYDPSRRLSSWLFGIASNLYKDWLHDAPRQAAVALPLPEQAAEHDDADPESLALAKGARDAVTRAVMELPAKYRDVLLLVHYSRLKYRDAALELDINEGTVKSRLNTAAGLLREKLRREGWVE